MLEPFLSLREAGFSRAGEAGVLSGAWTPELIASLDWLRLAELARAVASTAGCGLGGSRVFEDGSVIFAMFEAPKSSHPRRALVKIAGWHEWGGTQRTVEYFAREVQTARDARGILIAPGGFTAGARHAASEHHIELVDAARLCATLNSLPEDHSDFFHVITTVGDYSAPSCPMCLKRMTRRQQGDFADLPPTTSDYVFQASAIVAEPVVCRRLEVLPDCEVQFLHEVRAHDMMIRGHARGDFVCEGLLTLDKGATLNGTIAARAMDVRDGGELLGKARIIEGDLQPVVPAKPRWFWVCENPFGKPGCKRIMFEPHEQTAA